MAKKDKGVFEADRRMELRLRLAAKRAGDGNYRSSDSVIPFEIPKAEMLTRLIERVERI
jgi:hypothetical protein